MRLTFSVLAIGAVSLLATVPASAGGPYGVGFDSAEFGSPDFSNYLSPPGRGTCDFWRSAWLHACPTAVIVAEPVAAPAALPVKARAQAPRRAGQ